MRNAIYNADKVYIGYLDLIDGEIVAHDVNRIELGRFTNSLEAASAVLRHARQPAPIKRGEDELLAEIEQKLRSAAIDVEG